MIEGQRLDQDHPTAQLNGLHRVHDWNPATMPRREKSEPTGILATMNVPGPRYHDREESRFYQAGGLSPDQTWQALGDELARVLNDAQRTFWRTPLRMDPARVRWWHGAIFAPLPP